MELDLVPAVGAGGIFGMLVALFTLSMNAILKTGQRADSRADAEIERLHKEREIDEARYNAMVEVKNEEIAYWRDRYLAIVSREQPEFEE